LKYAILFGGASFEHEISIVSAIALKSVIKNELIFVFLSQERDFYLIESINMRSNYFAKGEYKKSAKLEIGHGGWSKKGLFGSSKIKCDCVVNMVHGGDGEDGKLASIFDFFGVRFVGPRLEASVMSFNKILTKHLARECGVKTLDYCSLNKKSDINKINIAYPFIIKPARLGSSIGVSVVKNAQELDYALDVAFEFDDEALIEPFVAGVKEYNLAGANANGFIYSLIEEPQKAEFLDFEKKYKDFSRTQRVFEADIPEQLQTAMKEAFAKLYSFGFEGAIIRCDFFVIDGEVYLNEVNPIPGSLANYLFDDFNSVLDKVASSLPKSKKITVEYKYINEIASAKGKA
jgi:D-alanine-D-alanine ligase